MKVWHDDIRPEPDGWTWARTNEVAIRLLANNDVTEISLDHDLGLSDIAADTPGAIFRDGSSDGATGLDLVRWMIEEGYVPSLVTIHSVNPVGARAMANALNDAGHSCTISPYSHRRRAA